MLSFVVTSASASTFQTEPAHPAAASTVMVVGTVTEVTRYVPPPLPPHGIVPPSRRRVALQVEETLKGSPQSQVSIDVPSGAFFELRPGERVLAHLVPFDP